MSPLLAVEDLVVDYRSARTVRAVNGISLDVAAGETVAVVGESGCGKSTLTKAILGLVEATAGQIRFDGFDVLHASTVQRKRFRRDVQMVFQDPFGSLDPRWRIGRSIAEPLRAQGVSQREAADRVTEVLAEVGLDPGYARRYPHEFSGGQRQRINIGRALAGRPKLILADEAVSALDVSVQAQILNLFKRVQAEHELAMVFVSHDLSVVEFVADRIVVLYLGEVMEEVATADLFDRPRHPYTRTLLSALPAVDPEARRKRIAPIGEPPAPGARPPGCPFASRCPVALDRCKSARPTLRTLPDGARIACHRVDEKGEPEYELVTGAVL